MVMVTVSISTLNHTDQLTSVKFSEITPLITFRDAKLYQFNC